MKNNNESASALRFGHITEFNANLHAAKVSFPDKGIVSNWLPVLTRSTSLFQDEAPLSAGEHVACVMAGNGYESGVILGAIFDQKNTPPVHEAKTRAITFPDGTKISYNSDSHKLQIEIDADIELKITGDIDKEIVGDILTKHAGESETVPDWAP